MQLREFRNTAKTGKTRIWRIGVDGDQVVTEYGELGGKMQLVSDTAEGKNVGRSNEVTPEEAAIQQMEREILLKTREGYREIGEEGRADTFDFADLPQNLCFYKPDNSLSAALLKLIENEEAWFARKRDGEMMVIVILEDRVDIYSRKMLRSHHLEDPDKFPWVARFDHIAAELLAHESIPPNTILLGEMVGTPSEDQRWHVAGVLKAKTAEAQKKQQESGLLHFYCWDIAYHGGEDLVSTITVSDRYDAITMLFGGRAGYVLPVDVYTTDDLREVLPNGDDLPPYDVAIEVLKALQWEGWVVVDPKGVFGAQAYNFRGKTDRPGKYSGKLKVEFEGDFIALWDPDGTLGPPAGTWGSGKRQKQVGAVELYEYSASGELVYICDCGGGLIKTDAFAEEYSQPECFPMVLKVLYTDRTYVSDGEKTNALTFPRALERRTDKTPDECVNPRL